MSRDVDEEKDKMEDRRFIFIFKDEQEMQIGRVLVNNLKGKDTIIIEEVALFPFHRLPSFYFILLFKFISLSGCKNIII